MHLPGLTYRGAPLDDVSILEQVPAEYAQLLAQRNGFVAFRGGLHVRGACIAPDWHAIRNAIEGPVAISRLFPGLETGDTPFGQDAWGNQFVLRSGQVFRLSAAPADVAPVAGGLAEFLAACLETPLEVLRLEPLYRYLHRGGSLAPGELLWGDPPAPLRAIEVLRRLAAAHAPRD